MGDVYKFNKSADDRLYRSGASFKQRRDEQIRLRKAQEKRGTAPAPSAARSDTVGTGEGIQNVKEVSEAMQTTQGAEDLYSGKAARKKRAKVASVRAGY